MCGIVGVLDFEAARPEAQTDRILSAMAAQLTSRGPHGSGSWVDEVVGIGLGHRRLSIIDLSPHGAQPMDSADGRLAITYNGEIYNHRELATDLRADGVRFHGHSDTEVLVEAIARWGLPRALDRVDGMFAFAVWDRAQRTLTLVRDRMGEKPLYYCTLRSGEFVFGSTLDALRAHPDFDRPVDRDALALYFRHKYVPAPWSIFEGVRKLEPGCLLSVGEGGRSATERYWSFFDVVQRIDRFTGTPEDAVEELDRLLCTSVGERLVADVPVGAFLSGGIDSSAVVAAAQRVSTQPVRTFTIGSTTTDYDESSDARAVAECLGTDHTELTVTDSEALKVIERIGGIWDEPFGDSSQVPTLLVSELAHHEVKVALSGDGGDELFLGYNRYSWVPRIWGAAAQVPLSVRRAVAPLGRQVPPGWFDRAATLIPRQRRPRMLGLKASKVLGVLDAPTAESAFNRLCSHWTNPQGLVVGSAEPPTVHSDSRLWPKTAGIVEHMAAVDTVTYLPDDILTKVDRATMSVSLEGRVPLLSRRIVEFAAGLPVDLRIREGAQKWPLRRVLAKSVAPELFERPKSGFGVPIEEWLRGPLRDWAEAHVHGSAVSGFLDPSVVRTAWDQHLSGRRNLAYPLWDVLMFSAWSEQRGIC